jgi:polyisoprenoid-binding protein YceI
VAGPDEGTIGRPAGQVRRRRSPWIVGAVVFTVLLIAVGGPWVYFHLIEGSTPAALQLPPASGVGDQPIVSGPVSGTWRASSGSQAGYRVEEILFGQHHTAVGRTDKVSGGVVISGTSVTAADFSVDLASLKSDQPSRDVQFHGHIMETYKYPNATFHLTHVIELGRIPGPVSPVSARATGDLTLRGLTEPVTATIRAERVPGGIDVTADIPVVFARWHIPNPSFTIAQVGNTGTVEVLLHLVPAT